MTKKTKNIEKECRFEGYFLMTDGTKIKFDVLEDEVSAKFRQLAYNFEFLWDKEDTIWLGEDASMFICADKVIGFNIDDYEVEI